jgi:hypothetical protein
MSLIIAKKSLLKGSIEINPLHLFIKNFPGNGANSRVCDSAHANDGELFTDKVREC